MNRARAVKIIKKIFKECSSIEGKPIRITHAGEEGVLSKSCQIHIDARNDDLLESCIQRVVERQGLVVKKEGSILILLGKIER